MEGSSYLLLLFSKGRVSFPTPWTWDGLVEVMLSQFKGLALRDFTASSLVPLRPWSHVNKPGLACWIMRNTKVFLLPQLTAIQSLLTYRWCHPRLASLINPINNQMYKPSLHQKSTQKNCELSCRFKPMSFGVICNLAINNKYSRIHTKFS